LKSEVKFTEKNEDLKKKELRGEEIRKG